jgi:uncharacterized protein
MTVQEQQMIDELVERIRNTQLNDKDPDAEQRLQQGLSGYPDALYVLAQTVLVQKYGLEQAQQKIQAMQAELDQLQQQPKPHGSFLGNLLGIHDDPPAPPPYQPVGNPNYAPYPAPAYPPQAYAQPVYAAPQSGGFLRSAMQTAAGVAAGEMMFQGMESLFHGFGGGYGNPGYGESRPTEVINNNYYGDDNPHEHHAADTSSDSSFYNPSDDASRESDTSKFADSTNNSTQDDYANTSDDTSGSDDYASNDGYDGGGDDSYSGGDDSST